jgi:hypothetical protein
VGHGNAGCAVVWRIAEGKMEQWSESWTWGGHHLGTGKEVLDAELYAILRATLKFAISTECNKNFTIFSDSQAAILRYRNDCRGPGQAMARVIIGWSHQVTQNRNMLKGEEVLCQRFLKNVYRLMYK